MAGGQRGGEEVELYLLEDVFLSRGIELGLVRRRDGGVSGVFMAGYKCIRCRLWGE